MRKLFLSTFVALAACASAAPEAGPKPSVGTPEPSAEKPAPGEVGGSILFLLAAIYSWPESAEGRPSIEIDVEKNADGEFVATVIQSGLLDDSIAATKDVLTLAEDGGWRVARKEQFRKCYTSGIFDWTAKPCS